MKLLMPISESIREILKAILYNKTMMEHLLSAQTEQKQSKFVVCSYHLECFLVEETKYQRATEGGFLFEELDRDYCFNCIKYYLKKMTKNCNRLNLEKSHSV